MGRRLAHKDARREETAGLEMRARHGASRVGASPNAVKKIPSTTDILLTVTETSRKLAELVRELSASVRVVAHRGPVARGPLSILLLAILPR